MFKTNSSGRNTIWGTEKIFGGTAPMLPVATGLEDIWCFVVCWTGPV